jgi:hypothetical protein
LVDQQTKDYQPLKNRLNVKNGLQCDERPSTTYPDEDGW